MMPKLITQTEVQLGPQGRLVIPAPLRRSLGFESGDSLIARMEEGRLILEKAETINPTDMNTLYSLKQLYTRVGNVDKLKIIDEKIKGQKK